MFIIVGGGGMGAHMINVIISTINCCVTFNIPPNDTYKNINGDLIYKLNVITITKYRVQRTIE